MNYQIITDEEKLKEFIDFLPDLQRHEQYCLCLFGRKKYSPEYKSQLPGDKNQLKKFTATKENMLSKIRQLECPLGAYEVRGFAVPQEALVLYVSPNPRDLVRAGLSSLVELAKKIEYGDKFYNPHKLVMSEIQKKAGNKRWIMFDVDDKNEEVLNKCIETVEGKCSVVETRGGYHILVEKDKVEKLADKKWYSKLQAMSDVCGDELTPVVGTIQGGFTPKLIKKYIDNND